MIPLTLAEIAAITGGRLRSARYPDTAIVHGSVHTDSRLVEDGSIFFALPGAETDGALYAQAAEAAGAVLVIAERPVDVGCAEIVVEDGVAALGALAAAVVTRVRASGHLSVVGITGSNGKTTTKNLLRAILSAEGPTVAPQGSFNNHVGAPVSMLGITQDTRFLIVEMGASGAGEIQRLVRIAKPDISVVLKVGLAHVGEFGGIDAVQRAKSEIVAELPETGVAVLNVDDPRVAAMQEVTAARVRWFGLDSSAELSAEDIVATASGTAFTLIAGEQRRPVRLRILGEHHVMNALAALSVADELGVDLDRAISAIEAVPRAERWRMELLHPGDGVIVINDAYNASPDSMAAALKTLAQLQGPGTRSVAVLGEMAELGEYSREEHDRIGRLAVRLGVQKLIVVGDGARHIHMAASLEGSWDGESVLVATPDEAYDLLREELREGDIVLVKSSKSAELRFLGDRLGGVTA
ncbi:UDP-N-acetylmuramoyl-tripeptide--D-alanyl-D-alanine ligase [Galbitalea soli]|uniref:UDP-N-acetylmuramoyl-tripeptide--D-alanyl-D-alanine ligase n=1 Tax=Galbitalea soli TaxID=1268042 RepID=A0A7C9PLF5_9MICO|nr:UDP-N-acetylmuramoyl-tripeptide--D-alanyl-D-alanine ligase [Galbitalea soli]NYJ30715.1 UDP-N-acetylmuramoyl-tripeptide--D-alanyl-D-alanine ligase [Galbitalea soli]